MRCDSEPLVCLLRLFDDGAQYGDPYALSLTCIHTDASECEIRGAMRAPTPSEWRALYRHFQECGVKTVRFARGDGRVREIVIKVRDNGV